MEDASRSVVVSRLIHDRYNQRPLVQAIIHAHSRSLMMYVISRKSPQCGQIPYINDFIGEIAEVPYILCGTERLVEMVVVFYVGRSL